MLLWDLVLGARALRWEGKGLWQEGLRLLGAVHPTAPALARASHG